MLRRGTFIHEEMRTFLDRKCKQSSDPTSVLTTFSWMYKTLLTIITSFTQPLEVQPDLVMTTLFVPFGIRETMS